MILTVTPNPCVDKTVFVDRIEIGTFMRSEKCTCIPGGKGTNVARAVKTLGRDARALIIVGGHPGAHVVDMIREQDGVDCIPIWVASQTRTITTVLEESIHRQTAFFEPGSRVTQEEAARIESVFAEAVGQARVVTFSGTVCDPSIRWLYKRLIPIAKNADAITILDAHGPEFAQGIESAPHMAKPNVAEAQELAGFTLDTDNAKWRAVDYLHNKGIRLVVLSLGKEGAFVSDGTQRFHAVPPVIKEINPVGSGDSLVAGFAIGLMEGMPLVDMARLAIAAGTANAMTWDIAHFEPAQVNALMDQVRILPA